MPPLYARHGIVSLANLADLVNLANLADLVKMYDLACEVAGNVRKADYCSRGVRECFSKGQEIAAIQRFCNHGKGMNGRGMKDLVSGEIFCPPVPALITTAEDSLLRYLLQPDIRLLKSNDPAW